MNLHDKFTVPISRIIVFLGLVSFFRPTIFEKFPITNTIFNGILIMALIATFVHSFSLRIWPNEIFIFGIIAFYIVALWSTYTNSASISRALMYSIIGMGSVLFVRYMISLELLYATVLMRKLLWLYTIINFLTIVLVPSGIVQTGASNSAVYFLGQPTRYAYFYIPALLFCYIGDEIEYGHITRNTVCAYFMCLASLIAAWTVGSSVAMLFLGVFFIFHKWRVFNVFVYFFVQLGAYISLVYYSIQDVFATFITLYLHKDVTLSSRTLIWRRALDAIENSPLWGVGILDNDAMKSELGFVHAHNHLLNVTFQMGYIGFGIMIFLILISYVRLNKYKENMIAKVISIFIFIIGIQLLMDTVDGVRNHYLFMIAMGAYIPDIVAQLYSEEGL